MTKRIEKEINGIKIILDEDVVEIYDEVVRHRRYFHQNPEPSLKEYNTCAYIRSELEKEGIDYIGVGQTGTLAIIRGEKDLESRDRREISGSPLLTDQRVKGVRTILLRGDIDALELNDDKNIEYSSINKGLCHACGHDAHAASLLGAAKILNRRRGEFGGIVKLAFQQAEEIGAGARQFVKAGHLDDVDFVFGTHLASNIEVGKLGVTEGPQSASCDIFKIRVLGQGAHASTPHLGRDAVVATSNIVLELQNIVSRQIGPLDEGLISIGKIWSGTRYNVVASEGVIEGTVRTFSQETREFILERVETIAELTAKIHGCSIEFENYDAAAPLINQKEKTLYYQKIANQIVGEDNVIRDLEKSLGAEDFADYLAVVPGTFIKVGSKSSSKNSYPHHHNLFDIDERCLYIETQSYVDLVTKTLI